ncbi:MAG: ice-binding family protein [Candidatus Berkelbacteria bacterium]
MFALVSLFTFAIAGYAHAATTTVSLGTSSSFAVLAGTAITDVPSFVITGNVGLSPAAGSNYAGLTQAEVTGSIYSVNAAGPLGYVENAALLTTAKNDLTTAYVDAAGRTPTTDYGAGDNQLGGKTLTAGVYAFGHATTANITAATPLTLDAQGDPNAVFIFQASSDLVTASSSVVQLINGAEACNVFWQVTSSVTFGTSSTFVGTVMALTSITDNGSSTINGRLLARNAEVALNKTTIIASTCAAPSINVTKTATPTSLTSAGGSVVYSYSITNPGTVALSSVTISDDKCTVGAIVSGDTDSDSRLDTTETWKYACTANITTTTTNTVTVSGTANGQTATKTATATVTVAAATTGTTATTTTTATTGATAAPATPALPSAGDGSTDSNLKYVMLLSLVAFSLIISTLVVMKRKATSVR